MKKAQQIIKNLLPAVLVIVLTAAFGWFQVGYSLDVSISDQLCQRESVTNRNIYIIAIDDKTLEQYGSLTSWSREIPARLVRILNSNQNQKPAVITFDVIYSEEGDSEGDAAFAQACREAGNVVTAMSYNFKERPETGEDGRIRYNKYSVDSVVLPYESLRETCVYGFANTLVGTDGYVRRAMAYVDDDGYRQYSLASQTYIQYQKSRDEKAVFPKLDENNQYLFAYSGVTGCYSTVSMADVLDGTVNPAVFADAIVFVGAYAVGMQDAYTPAISHGGQMFGVEIQANITEALLEERTQQSFPKGIYALITAIVAGLFYYVLKKLKVIPATILAALLLIAHFVFVYAMYQTGWVIQTLPIPVAVILIYAEYLIVGYVREIMRRKRVVDVFKQYVAPQVVDKISKDKDFELVLGGENRHIACLFVDIRGFTTMSESLEPEEVVEILNEYLSLTTNSIFKNGGTLDKFVGDAAMAVFNAPFDLDDYIYRAVCTARDMKAGADAIAEKFKKRFGKSVEFGIGINCGNAVVGNIGCEFRMDYTAIGDTVNTAARLESNAKQGQILISAEVYEAVRDRVKATPIGEIPLKGKSKGVFVFQLDEVK